MLENDSVLAALLSIGLCHMFCVLVNTCKLLSLFDATQVWEIINI
jgi:hypothetical protein